VVSSRAALFIPEDGGPGSHWIGFWVNPRAYLDMSEERESPCPYREFKPGRLTCSPVTMLTDFPRLQSRLDGNVKVVPVLH